MIGVRLKGAEGIYIFVSQSCAIITHGQATSKNQIKFIAMRLGTCLHFIDISLKFATTLHSTQLQAVFG